MEVIRIVMIGITGMLLGLLLKGQDRNIPYI